MSTFEHLTPNFLFSFLNVKELEQFFRLQKKIREGSEESEEPSRKLLPGLEKSRVHIKEDYKQINNEEEKGRRKNLIDF